MIKRIFDFTSSLIAIILLAPVIIIISVIIKIDSRGPVFFVQRRVGKDNIDFKLLKFRTMYNERKLESLITIGNKDPRITRFGSFLRKYKIDEIPQLLNVIFSQMSIVGPRPEVRKYVNFYDSKQLKVLSVKPGITDMASIFFSNENEMLANQNNPEKFYIENILPQKLEISLNYISNMSLKTDLVIIFKTFKKILEKN